VQRFTNAIIVIYGVGMFYTSFWSWIFAHYIAVFLKNLLSISYLGSSVCCIYICDVKLGPLLPTACFTFRFVDENVLYNASKNK